MDPFRGFLAEGEAAGDSFRLKGFSLQEDWERDDKEMTLGPRHDKADPRVGCNG